MVIKSLLINLTNIQGYKKLNLIKYNILLFFVFAAINVYSQDTIVYSRDYIFKEGIYPNYNAFKRNKPIEIKRIVSDYDKTKLDFIAAITSKKYIIYLDSLNNKDTIKPAELWGYCQNQAIYINYNEEFFRVPVVGNLFHFMAYRYVTMSYGTPNIYGYSSYPTTVREQAQFIFDNESQTIREFNATVMEEILMRDEALYKEFMALSNRKKKQSVFIYLRKYNEKRPLYFLK